MFLEVLITLALVQGAQGGCCFPEKWEGLTDVTEGYHQGNKSGFLTGIQSYSCDNTKQKISIDQNIMVDGSNYHSHVIQDFAAQKQYIIYKNTCQVEDLGMRYDRCIPDDAVKLRDTYFGGPNVQLPVTTYMYKKNQTTCMPTVTNTGCFLVGLRIRGPLFGRDVLLTVGYTGITLGVKNESVFDIPTFCHHRRAKSKKLPDIHQRILSPAILV